MPKPIYKFSNEELVKRYKEQYYIPEDITITIEQVIRHWELEKELTRMLLKSKPENRRDVFDYCYSTLYKELDWLNEHSETNNLILPPEQQYRVFVDFIGKLPKKIYEVGSGRGILINYLATLGHECRATEITKERGEKHTEKNVKITWAETYGIHLDTFENKVSYDFVISNVVIEHIHPDDLLSHFKGAYEILTKGGKYIFSTPHKFYGPTDISNVFGIKKPLGMHLKEYMVFELVRKLRKAGFKKIYFPYRVYTKKFYKVIPYARHEIAWISISERLLNLFPLRVIKMILKFERRILNIPTIYIAAEK